MSALGRKTRLTEEDWRRGWDTALDVVSAAELDDLIDRAVTEIRARTRGRKAAYAWSGGKDSIALGWLARQAGVELSMLGVSYLEYPAFQHWVSKNAPFGLEIINTGQDLHWLAANQHMLFPQGKHGSHWFTLIQHRAQAQFYRAQELDMILLGRRKADGNYVGKGANIYTDARGVTRYSPIADWSHEALFALLQRESLPLPPIYDWPRGFTVGTGAWAARQGTRDVAHGFEEVWSIDPDVVREAATVLPQAAEFMAQRDLD